MPQVQCVLHKFSQKWDDKLDLLLEEGDAVSWNEHSITFRLNVGAKLQCFWLFLTKEVPVYETYIVWTANRTCGYGRLYEINDVGVPEHLQYAASQKTLNKLLALENKLRYPMVIEAYGE